MMRGGGGGGGGGLRFISTVSQTGESQSKYSPTLFNVVPYTWEGYALAYAERQFACIFIVPALNTGQ